MREHKAKIIECKTRKMMEGEELKNDSYKYDYYIHYLGKNRRLDEWVPRDRITLTNELVEDDNNMKKGKERLKEEAKENEEFDSMDPTQIQQHEEMTKFKTIS